MASQHPVKSPPRPRLRLRGRSFIAVTLAPIAPVADWLAELEQQIARAPTFFADRPVVVDLSALFDSDDAVPGLVDQLQTRGVRVIGVEGPGAERAAAPGWVWPTPLRSGRVLGDIEVPEEGGTAEPAPPPAEPTASLLVDKPVRSGQTVMFAEGDITVLSSVSSGAEVIAGGSIHVYGVLRGRAIAGFTGHPGARIFCRKLEAELLAIDGLYRTAEEMPAALRGKPAQVWLEGDVLQIAALA